MRTCDTDRTEERYTLCDGFSVAAAELCTANLTVEQTSRGVNPVARGHKNECRDMCLCVTTRASPTI